MQLVIYNPETILPAPVSMEDVPTPSLIGTLHVVELLFIWLVMLFAVGTMASYGRLVLDVVGLVVFSSYLALMTANMDQFPDINFCDAVATTVFLALVFLHLRSLLGCFNENKPEAEKTSQNSHTGSKQTSDRPSSNTALRFRLNLGRFFSVDLDYKHERTG